ncbi:unnamed protein product [Boreogadus saida]
MNMCNFKKLSSSPPLTGATMVSSSSSALQRFQCRYCFPISVSSAAAAAQPDFTRLGSSDGDASCVNPVTFAVTALDIDPFKEGADREDIHSKTSSATSQTLEGATQIPSPPSVSCVSSQTVRRRLHDLVAAGSCG